MLRQTKTRMNPFVGGLYNFSGDGRARYDPGRCWTGADFDMRCGSLVNQPAC